LDIHLLLHLAVEDKHWHKMVSIRCLGNGRRLRRRTGLARVRRVVVMDQGMEILMEG
jgi:hypothetical protein